MAVNKSEAIRELLRANPQAAPSAIIAELKARGVKVNSGLVSNVKSNWLRDGAPAEAPQRGGARKKRRKARAGDNGHIKGLGQFLAAAELLRECEDPAEAEAMLRLVAKLRE